MQMVNCLVALGGDRRNTVPKKCITVAEIAVLQRIHGGDAIFDVEPATAQDIEDVTRRLDAEYAERGGYKIDKDPGSISLSARGELARLRERYARARNEDGQPIIEEVYPGAGANIFHDLQSLGLPEDAFKAVERAKPEPAPKRGRQKPAEPTVDIME